MSDKTYRIRTNISQDSVVNVNLNQDYENLEILSIKIGTESAYKLHTSDYGCLVGRVLANGNFGIPNAKVSIFIALDEEGKEDEIISYLYPYGSIHTTNKDGIRYNLLPEDQLSDCHRNVGTFPSKRTVLDDNNVFEVYDNYYKFTTRTNNAGDYMIFGIPVGNQTVHVDIDLSDIGILSQTPRDMIYKGYSATQFENSNMFKKDINLDNLSQIISQNATVDVKPFWGASDIEDIAITRKDFEVQYKFEPTCVFIGSIITDDKSNGVSKRCVPSERMGKMDRITTGNGTIEMIRKTPDGLVEEEVIQGNQLIDGNGAWCYQIPMNLDYMMTDEYGNMTPTDDPTKGIPTRTRVRFRMSLTDFENEGEFSHTSKTLVPNNPKNIEDLDYAFGSDTKDDEFGTKSFRDLFWNNVYTVKSYIPRVQNGAAVSNRNRRFTGIKAVNVNNSNNQIPYNNMRVNLTFMFTLQCAIFHMLIWMINVFNKIIKVLYGFSNNSCLGNTGDRLRNESRCLYLGNGYCPNLENWYFAPGCDSNELLNKTAESIADDGVKDVHSVSSENSDGNQEINITKNIDYFVQCTEINMAMEYDVIQFDFYNDWINGLVYTPRWYADIRKKRSYLFGTIRIKPRLNACFDSTFNKYRRYVQQCALSYRKSGNGNFTIVETPNGCTKNGKQKCHRNDGRKSIKIMRGTKNGGGMVHNQQVLEGKYAYYFKPCEWVSNGVYEAKCNLFATDIVLIGSMDKYNLMGIPQTFKKLQPTSFQIPDTLASTNLGVDGYVYGGNSNPDADFDIDNIPQVYAVKINGVYREYDINGQPVSETSPDSELVYKAELAFKTIYGLNKQDIIDEIKSVGNEYIRSGVIPSNLTIKDYSFESGMDKDEYEVEYAVTESSGIDWGFKGPNQGENNFENLYFPGGHFLGISCFDSETNIKSCVNLSRICELGSMISQRKEYVKYDGASGRYKYYYIIPDGLISKYDINDYGMRKEFSSMNHNGLRTKMSGNGLLEYDFSFINPVNFAGELSSNVNNESYNSRSKMYDDASTSRIDSTTFAYRSNVEEESDDYYRFRMGLHGEDGEMYRKYLRLENGNDRDIYYASLPVYENSYYFYFGIKNGSTALDRFYNEFFAECPSLKSHEPIVTFEITDSYICDDNPEGNFEEGKQGSGKVHVYTKNLEDISYSVYIGEDMIKDYTPSISDDFEIDGLCSGVEYNIRIYSSNFDEITIRATAGARIPEEYDTGIYADVTDFSRKVRYDADNFQMFWNQECDGYVNIQDYGINSGITYAIRHDGEYHVIYGDGNEVFGDKKVEYGNIHGSIDGNIYLWKCDADYEILGVYYCGEEYDNKRVIFKLNEFHVGHNETLDITIGNSNALFYDIRNDLESFGVDDDEINDNWFKYILSSGYTESSKYGITDAENLSWAVKKALFYQKSQCVQDGSGESVTVYASNGNPPYNVSLVGSGEKFDGSMVDISESGITKEYAENNGYVMDMSMFYMPTIDGPRLYEGNGYFTGYTTNGRKKGDYFYSIKDSTGKTLPKDDKKLRIPSIYRPFFFNAVYIFLSTENTSRMSYAVMNGVTYNEGNGPRFGSIKVNGNEIPEDMLIRKREDAEGNEVYINDIDFSLYEGDELPDSMTLSGKSIESAYPVLVGGTNIARSSRDVPKFTFEVSEYNGNNSISGNISANNEYAEETVHFMGDEKEGTGDKYGYDSRIRYFCCDTGITWYELEQFYNNICAYSTNIDENYQYFTHYSGDTISGIENFNVVNKFQWRGCKFNSDKEGSYYAVINGNKAYILNREIPSSLLSTGNVNIDYGDYCAGFYIGVYDKWSVLSDEQYNSNNLWEYVAKHTNMISVIKIYSKMSFRVALQSSK